MSSRPTRAFGPVDKALRAVLRRDLVAVVGHPERVDAELPDVVDELYIRFARLPGSAGEIQGDFVYDIEVFSPDYNTAESAAADTEALLLRYPHIVKVDEKNFVFDRVRVNTTAHEIPWDDDTVSRLLATYVITLRR